MKEITPPSSLLKTISKAFFVASLFVTGATAHAAETTSWYVNPQGNSCTPVAADYDQSTLPPGWTFEEVGCNWESMSGCSYQICSPSVNDTYNYFGAVASFGASINKSNYTPGEWGTVTILGSLGSHIGSDIANALLFFNLGNPFLNSITCFFFSCPVTREVRVNAVVPRRDDNLADRNNQYLENQPDDSFGYGYPSPQSVHNFDNGQDYSWTGYDDLYYQQRKGSIYGSQVFKTPTTPGTYTVDLIGCHEKYYCVTPASLTFTVGAPAPTININFSYNEIMRKVRSWFE